ncbi:hypothetical protein GGI07_000961 [Coemansia sp. Benny D115]|nr:hypothetical protein GGI07_000961 [Coemansia sp. Benny D115]
MAKLTAQDKANIKQAQEVEAQLRASVNGASKIVSSWLGPDDSSSDDENEQGSNTTHAGGAKARDIFKGRPARLGVGAKFLSHKEMMASGNAAIGPGILTAEELQLKRKLTGKQSLLMSATKHKDLADDKTKNELSEDDEDSRSKSIGSKDVSGESIKRELISGHSNPVQKKKKKNKTTEFLDSLNIRRKR